LVLPLGVLAAILAVPSAATADTPRARIPVLLDTDIGDDIDDAFALALVLASPELDLRGVTTVAGDAYTRALLVCRLLHEAGRETVPVAAGRPPQDTPNHQGQLQYARDPGFRKRPVKELAADFLYRQLKDHPGELTLLAIGPLTNVAELLTRHPDCKPWIKRVVLMGGSVRVGYNDRPPPEAEWNIKSDAPAARTVFTSGVPLLVAPLDATTSLKLGAALRKRIFDAHTPLSDPLHALYRLWGKPTPTLFDPVAAALCFDERWCKIEELRLEVDDKGFTRVAPGKPNARVAVSVRGDAFLEWFTDRLVHGTAARKGRGG
jgi:inosine-uridine nucleoside N-ribohydrolase